MTADVDLEALMRRFTPKQRAKLTRLDRAPWKWFISDARFFALMEEYDRDAKLRYWRVLSRVSSYTGPDYQIKPGNVWMRAYKNQYEQAQRDGIPHRIVDAYPTPQLTAA